MIHLDELRHLVEGPRPGGLPGGAGLVDVRASTSEPERVLTGCREVMAHIIEHQVGEWPAFERWSAELPGWFVEACGPDLSEEEAERWLSAWRALPPVEQAKAEEERRWSLADWLYWMAPHERQWYWWDAAIEDDRHLRVTVEIAGWPAPLGALVWLLRAARAEAVLIDEPST